MDKEHWQRKMMKARSYVKEKATEYGRLFLLILCGLIYYAGIWGICFAIIWPVAHWLHLGTNEGDWVSSFACGVILGTWLLFNVPRFVEWLREPEPGDELAPHSIPESKVIASFTGKIVRAAPLSQFWLEVPMIDTEGEVDTFDVRLYSPTDWGGNIISNHEGEIVTVTGAAYIPDDFDGKDYNLVLVVTMVSVVSPDKPQLQLAQESRGA